jgi:hypothetical protein
MPKQLEYGICHICGVNGRLSREHIPPQAAFNKRPYLLAKGREILELGPDMIPQGKLKQGGVSMFTLCEQCNIRTGRWYGPAFIEWCYQGMELLRKAGGHPTLAYFYQIYPIRVLKQIVTMFFSVNTSTFREYHPELERFVLNTKSQHLSPYYRFFIFYKVGGLNRYIGECPIYETPTHRYFNFSEITFPPFGYVMTLGSEPPDPRLLEITFFSHYAYDDSRILELRPTVLPVETPLPGEYSTLEEIRKRKRRNTLLLH